MPSKTVGKVLTFGVGETRYFEPEGPDFDDFDNIPPWKPPEEVFDVLMYLGKPSKDIFSIGYETRLRGPMIHDPQTICLYFPVDTRTITVKNHEYEVVDVTDVHISLKQKKVNSA
jgi:hypothetical protein